MGKRQCDAMTSFQLHHLFVASFPCLPARLFSRSPNPPFQNVCTTFAGCLEQVIVGDPCKACIEVWTESSRLAYLSIHPQIQKALHSK